MNMQKYFAHADSVKVDSKEFDFYVELYLATQVDARIAELEREVRELVLANTALKAELDFYTDEG
jgi:uncharacterized alkaline shock family protein YloU